MLQKGCYVPRDCEYKHIRRKLENRGRQEQDTKTGEGRAEFQITENAEEIRQHFKNKSKYLFYFPLFSPAIFLLKCHLRKYMNYENTYPEVCDPVREKIHWKYCLELQKVPIFMKAEVKDTVHLPQKHSSPK